MLRKMRRLNVINVIPVNISHMVNIKEDAKSPWDNNHMKKVYHENILVVEEDLDIREENDDYHENTRDKKISFIRQITTTICT